MNKKELEKNFTPKFVEILLELETYEDPSAFFYQNLVELGQVERINNLYRCADKHTKKRVWFRPNSEQLNYLNNQSRRDMILKPRQIGFTELSIIIGRDNCIFVPGSTEGMMAHTRDKAIKNLFQRVRDGFQWFLEDWGELIPLVFGKDEGTKVIILSAAGVSVKTTYEVAVEFRSSSLTRLHRSEAAFTDTRRLKASADAVPEKCQIIDESTPNGMGGLFYANWMESKKAVQNSETPVWKPHFFPWYDHYPEDGTDLVVPKNLVYTEEEQYLKGLGASDLSIVWRRWKIRENFIDEPELFDQEYPSDDVSCFLGGLSVVPRKYQVVLKKWVLKPVKIGFLVSDERWLKLTENSSGCISIWEPPQIKEQYVIGADASQGIGKDWSVAYVRKRSNGHYVAKIRGQLYPEEFAEELYKLAMFYNRAYICFEVNNHGWVVKDRLVNIKKYTNLYHRRELDTITGKWKNEIGFSTDRTSKERIVNNWVARLREGKLHPMDETLLHELSSFQRDENGRLSAKAGENDDCCMAAFLTEEMDVALGEYRSEDEVFYDDIRYNPVTGMPYYDY